jgi:hypothetical protein
MQVKEIAAIGFILIGGQLTGEMPLPIVDERVVNKEVNVLALQELEWEPCIYPKCFGRN